MGDRLRGKVAIVAGAGAVPGPADRPPIGNGRAAAILYGREGASVFAVDLDLGSAEETKRMIEADGGTCVAFKADVTCSKDCRAVAEACVANFGRIDILHNNVGIGPHNPAEVVNSDEEDWDRVMTVNVKGLFNTCHAVLPQMIKQGNGVILNISSLAAVLYPPKLLIYSVSKAAVNAFTHFLAAEIAGKGIRVNCIMPGMIDSPCIYKEILPLHDGDIGLMRQRRNDAVPMQHMGGPWDIAYASLFLVSDEAKFITGQVLSVDGGHSCKSV
jgi:NAD(P)-dependent dehydrogenase (short-subunit alcohol dehydrogenase family)